MSPHRIVTGYYSRIDIYNATQRLFYLPNADCYNQGLDFVKAVIELLLQQVYNETELRSLVDTYCNPDEGNDSIISLHNSTTTTTVSISTTTTTLSTSTASTTTTTSSTTTSSTTSSTSTSTLSSSTKVISPVLNEQGDDDNILKRSDDENTDCSMMFKILWIGCGVFGSILGQLLFLLFYNLCCKRFEKSSRKRKMKKNVVRDLHRTSHDSNIAKISI